MAHYYIKQHSVGFSGVLFALVVIDIQRSHDVPTRSVMGFVNVSIVQIVVLGKSSKELRLLAERSERHSGLVTFLQCLQNSCSDESKNVAAEYAALAEKYRNAGDEGSSLYPAGRAAAPLRVRISRSKNDRANTADAQPHSAVKPVLLLCLER